jgi:hypothetical protein
MMATAIAAVMPRRRTVVRGDIVAIESYEQPWVRTDARITDASGTLVLRFFGRTAIPGLEVGRQIEAEGTVGLVRGVFVMVNPLYSFTRVG